MIQRPKGTRDLLAKELTAWNTVEEKAKKIFKNYSFKEIRLPVFENTELFLRGVGETTDVVQKEMYTFEDKGKRSISLRPEGTAGAVRAYIENGMSSEPTPVKLWYNITAYRYENVQKGRLREFHQLGAEVIGTESYLADAEMIVMANEIFKKLNIEKIKLEINSIGCPNCRPKYQKDLKEYISDNIVNYCPDCEKRFEKNPMRILDCKNKICKIKNELGPKITDYLCEECENHFKGVTKVLDSLKLNYTINPRIVRGLDYYTKTVFEFIDEEEGYTVLAGGRYDGLVKELEGQNTPAVGFALGLERLIEIYNKCNSKEMPEMPEIFFVTIGERADLYVTELVKKLREEGKFVEKDICGKNLKGQFKYADRIGANYVVTIGDAEVDSKIAKIKDMSTGEEKEYKLI